MLYVITTTWNTIMTVVFICEHYSRISDSYRSNEKKIKLS